MTAVDPFQAMEKIFSVGAALGIVQAAAEDEHLDGGISTVDGRRMVNFGSGGYIGMHPSLTAAGPKRFTGAAHPVLATLTFVLPARPAAEACLSTLFGRPTSFSASTSTGRSVRCRSVLAGHARSGVRPRGPLINTYSEVRRVWVFRHT